MSELKVTLRIDFDIHNAVGPGKIALLEKMRDCGSLSQAARELKMSYRRAWQLLDSLNRSFREPLVLTSTGGMGGGGTTLTELGDSIVHAYRKLEQETIVQASHHFGAMMRSVNPRSGTRHRSVARKPRRRIKSSA